MASLNCPSEDEIGRIGEAKASRDILIHNRGIANKIYVSKSDAYARYNENEPIDISEKYHRESFELLRKVVEDICSAGLKKAG